MSAASRLVLGLMLAAASISVAASSAPLEPIELEFKEGGSRSLHVRWERGGLEVLERGGFGPDQGRVFRSERVTPSAADWKEFWGAMEKIGVWSWSGSYSSKESAQMDGVAWSFDVDRGGRRLQTRGYNATPPDFLAFTQALRRLARFPSGVAAPHP